MTTRGYSLIDEAEKISADVETHLEHVADVMKELDERKQELVQREAELDIDIRSYPGRYGFDSAKKPTENLIKTTIVTEDSVIKLEDEIIDLKYKVRRLEAKTEGLKTKRSMIKAISRFTAELTGA